MSNNNTSSSLRSLCFSIWLAFAFLILGAIIIIRPGWGFMDDHNNLRVARGFWMQPSIQSLNDIITGDVGIGRFQPLYKLWIITAYQIGATAPWLIYFFTTLIGFLVLPCWGFILDKIFNNGRRSPFWIWVYPLAFFIFVPFWNAFMYLSIQEKFVYLFSAPAIFYFCRAYENKSWSDLGWSFLFCFMTVMGKETGVALFLAFATYAFFDALWFKRQPLFSWAVWAGNTMSFVLYYFFIQKLLRNYTAKYANNLNLFSLWGNFNTSPFYIKIITSFSIAILVWHFTRKLFDARFPENGRTLFAWLSFFYIMILLPWGFPTYLLPPLAVFVVGAAASVFPAGDQWPRFKLFKRSALVALAFLTAALIIIPQIEKMADKRKIVAAIKDLSSAAPQTVFFYPAPYSETATSIHIFSGALIHYLSDSALTSGQLDAHNQNYLLMNDECHPALLTDVAPVQTIYQNSTWKIYALETKPGYHAEFKEQNIKNPLQKITALIKQL